MGSIENLPNNKRALQAHVKVEAARTLHASWMRDGHILELEKRAIFSNVSTLVGGGY